MWVLRRLGKRGARKQGVKGRIHMGLIRFAVTNLRGTKKKGETRAWGVKKRSIPTMRTGTRPEVRDEPRDRDGGPPTAQQGGAMRAGVWRKSTSHVRKQGGR